MQLFQWKHLTYELTCPLISFGTNTEIDGWRSTRRVSRVNLSYPPPKSILGRSHQSHQVTNNKTCPAGARCLKKERSPQVSKRQHLEGITLFPKSSNKVKCGLTFIYSRASDRWSENPKTRVSPNWSRNCKKVRESTKTFSWGRHHPIGGNWFIKYEWTWKRNLSFPTNQMNAWEMLTFLTNMYKISELSPQD